LVEPLGCRLRRERGERILSGCGWASPARHGSIAGVTLDGVRGAPYRLDEQAGRCRRQQGARSPVPPKRLFADPVNAFSAP
jgi:hypothetical protein